MSNEFEQISIKPGFMKHNGGVLFRTISETEYCLLYTSDAADE